MRALILSDIHGNLEALDAVLAAAGRCDAVWNLGDVVGYGASPNEVVERIRRAATLSVRGNHDKVCAGVASANHFTTNARTAALWTREHLTAACTEWLRALPEGPLAIDGEHVVLAHGSPLNEDIYIQTIRDAWVPLQQMEAGITFFGHTHVQGGFGWESDRWFEVRPQQQRDRNHASEWALELDRERRYLLNPGSVGQPRDSDSRAAYAVYDSTANNVVFHRVPYDIDLAQGRILLANLPESLAKRLREGR